MRGLGLVFAFLLVCAVCKSASQTLDMEGQGPKSYSCQGVVQRVIIDQRRVTIHHKKIPGFMPEMTMDFNVKNTNELKGILPGAEISFSLLVLQNDAWIENLHCLGYHAPAAGQTGLSRNTTPELKAGDKWPDGELLAEDGRHLHFSDFRGRTLALSFFFTRCPMPDFCPRMNKDFAEARNLLPSASSAQTNYFFLSISFDPDFDTPDRLAAYAQSYRKGDRDQWLFTAASPDTLDKLPRRLGLSVKRQGDGISHNLRTVVLDPQGRVYRQFDGNNWTSQELASAMQQANQQRNSTPSQ